MMFPRRFGPPNTVVTACVLLGVTFLAFFVQMVRDGGTDRLSGAGWVIGSLIICTAVAGSLAYQLVHRSRGVARFVTVVAGLQVLVAPLDWLRGHAVHVDGVLRLLLGGGIAVLLTLPPSRAWFDPRSVRPARPGAGEQAGRLPADHGHDQHAGPENPGKDQDSGTG